MTGHKDKFPEVLLVNNLKEIRKSKGITQQELADMLGLDRMSINSIENGRFCPSVKLGLEIAAMLDVQFEELFSLTTTNLK